MKVFLLLCLVPLALADINPRSLTNPQMYACRSMSRSECLRCCNHYGMYLQSLIECHGMCYSRPIADQQKRFLLDGALSQAQCELRLTEAACQSCCDESFTGLLGAAERPACKLLCRVLPGAPPEKK